MSERQLAILQQDIESRVFAALRDHLGHRLGHKMTAEEIIDLLLIDAVQAGKISPNDARRVQWFLERFSG